MSGSIDGVTWSAADEAFMKEALREAKFALESNEVPVGCVLVDKTSSRIIARGHNRVNESCNPTRHAEFEAMNDIEVDGANFNLRLYVTCEPCCMCAAALRYAGITDVVYGSAYASA